MVKRILLITFEYPLGKTYCGGVGQVVKQCRHALMDLGYEVSVLVTPHFKKTYPLKVLTPHGKTVNYPDFWAFKKDYNLLDFDFIIQNFVNWTRDLRRLKGNHKKRPKIIYHFHSILRREKDAGFKTFNRFLLNQERMIEIADAVICPSRYEYENFNRYFPHFSDKVRLIENSIETFPLKREIISRIRKQYSIKKNDIVSVYVGRLEQIKGAHLLIDYLPEILDAHQNKKIFIVGKPLEKSLHRKLRRLCQRYPKRLFYIKYLAKDHLFQLYYLSHIYINASLSESFSLSTYEGAFCNTSLLLNDLPVFDRFRKSAVFFSHQKDSQKNFIKQYNHLIRNRKLRRQYSQKASYVARSFVMRDRLKEGLHDFVKAC